MSAESKIVNEAVKILDTKMATDILVLDVRGLTTLTDYFVIATGKSNNQVQSLCDYLEEDMLKAGYRPLSREGYNTANWILLGYDEVMVHIFQEETREFYKLEHIWKDAPLVDMSDIIIE